MLVEVRDVGKRYGAIQALDVAASPGNPMDQLRSLGAYFPMERGSFWFAASFTVVLAFSTSFLARMRSARSRSALVTAPSTSSAVVPTGGASAGSIRTFQMVRWSHT